MENAPERLLDALENIATELERLRLLKEHELRVRIEYSGGDFHVVPVEREAKPAEE